MSKDLADDAATALPDLPPGLLQTEPDVPETSPDIHPAGHNPNAGMPYGTPISVRLPAPGQLVVLRLDKPTRAIRIDEEGRAVGSPFLLPATFVLTETIAASLTCQFFGGWIFQVQTDGHPARWVRPYSGPSTVPVWEVVPNDQLPRQPG